jgi:hypothetical protein
MIIDFINEDGRPDTIMVRDDLCTLVLQEFCEKIDVKLVHSQGMPATDEFAEELPAFLETFT